jgi:hypothetical protein
MILEGCNRHPGVRGKYQTASEPQLVLLTVSAQMGQWERNQFVVIKSSPYLQRSSCLKNSLSKPRIPNPR